MLEWKKGRTIEEFKRWAKSSALAKGGGGGGATVEGGGGFLLRPWAESCALVCGRSKIQGGGKRVNHPASKEGMRKGKVSEV